MNELESRNAAYRRLKPKYKLIVRGLGLCLLLGPMLILGVFNLALAHALGMKPGIPVNQQTFGEVWVLLFLAQFIVVVPFALFGGRRLLAHVAGKHLGWSEKKIEDIGTGRSYPEHWSS